MINVLPFKQSDSSRCGPAVIKMILNYYGLDVTEDEICVYCDHTYAKGCTDKGMEKAFRHYGFDVKIQNDSKLEDLEYWVKKHFPIIVDYYAGGESMDDMADGHSGIVVDIDKETVYVLDPSTARILQLPRHSFLRNWFDWRDEEYITNFNNMVMRQMIIPYPSKLIEKRKKK